MRLYQGKGRERQTETDTHTFSSKNKKISAYTCMKQNIHNYTRTSDANVFDELVPFVMCLLKGEEGGEKEWGGGERRREGGREEGRDGRRE